MGLAGRTNHSARIRMMLWPNATRVLRDMGLLESVLARSGSSTNFLVRASCGKVLMTIALGKFDVPAVCVRRADLLAVLLATLQPEQVRLGHEFHHLEQSRDKVRVYFADGDMKEHDAVIGADGIRSRVRQGCSAPPIQSIEVIWSGAASPVTMAAQSDPGPTPRPGGPASASVSSTSVKVSSRGTQP